MDSSFLLIFALFNARINSKKFSHMSETRSNPMVSLGLICLDLSTSILFICNRDARKKNIFIILL